MGVGMTAGREKRTELARIIKFQIAEHRKSARDVSNRVGVSIGDVEKWQTGELVPDRAQYKRLCGMVARTLYSFMGLHTDALREQEEERELSVRALRRNGHGVEQKTGQTVATNFGDKLVVALATPEPAPVDDPPQDQSGARPRRFDHPEGWKMPAAIAAREERAREILRARPEIRESGKDSLRGILHAEFGVGISNDAFNRIREEVRRERYAADVAAAAAAKQAEPPPPAAPPPVSPTAPRQVATGTVNDADVSAGVALLVGAIPGLMQLTIDVDDNGVSSVRYVVRKVQITEVSSSLTVRR